MDHLNGYKHVLISEDGRVASLAARDLTANGGWDRIMVLSSGMRAWRAAGFPLESGDGGTFLVEPRDDWRRPYLDPDASREAQLAYLGWEAGLTAQLRAEPNGDFGI